MKEKKINKKVLIIGAQEDGLELSLQLAERGLDVILAEKSGECGIRMKEDKLMPLSFELSADYINGLIRQVENNPHIEIMKNTIVDDIEGYIGNYIVHLKKDKIITRGAGAIVLSGETGSEGAFKDVTDNFIPLSRFKKLLDPGQKLRGKILSVGNKAPNSVVFLLTNDSSSRMQFTLVLNYALFLKQKMGMDVWILLPQVLVAGSGLEKYFRQARQEGIIIKQFEKMPALNYKTEGRVVIGLNEAGYGDIEVKTDLLIYGEKINRSPYLEKLRAILNFKDYTNIKFLSSKTPRKGVYFCGLGRDDMLFEEMLAEIRTTADDIFELIGEGAIKYEDNIIEVDKVKCAVCLTCARACPHAAIEVRQKILKERAIFVIEEACFRCGVCVSECPAKALSYKENS